MWWKILRVKKILNDRGNFCTNKARELNCTPLEVAIRLYVAPNVKMENWVTWGLSAKQIQDFADIIHAMREKEG